MRTLTLRRADRCRTCGIGLQVGAVAQWDPAARRVHCLACTASDAEAVSEATVVTSPMPQAVGIGGGSAQREYERLVQRRADDMKAEHPRTARLRLALTEVPASTRVWRQGAEGERKVAATLEGVDGVQTLHDRRLRRGSQANIDHLTVAPSGIWVIDAKTHHGKLEIRREGGLSTPRVSRLYIRGRDRTELVEGVLRQADVVREAVREVGVEAEVCGVLCFVGTELPWRDVAIDGVPLIGRRGLAKRLSRPGPHSPDQVAAMVAQLAVAFPAA